VVQGTIIEVGPNEEGEAEFDEFFDTYLATNVVEVTDTPQLLGELTRAKDRLVIVYFYSASCHACALVRPLLGQLAQETWEDVVYLKVSSACVCPLTHRASGSELTQGYGCGYASYLPPESGIRDTGLGSITSPRLNPLHSIAQLPPGGVQCLRACPHAQPGCPTRGAPPADTATQLHFLSQLHAPTALTHTQLSPTPLHSPNR